jgi:hypothetical protein
VIGATGQMQPKEQDIIKLIAALQAANNLVNDENLPDEIAILLQSKVVTALEKKVCAAIEYAKATDGYICDDELRAVDDVLLDPNDPPEFADRFKAELFRLRAA